MSQGWPTTAACVWGRQREVGGDGMRTVGKVGGDEAPQSSAIGDAFVSFGSPLER